MTTQDIIKTWKEYRDIPAYQHILHMMNYHRIMDITNENFELMDYLDEQRDSFFSEQKEVYRKEVLPESKKQIDEFKEEVDPEFATECKVRYLKEAIESLTKLLIEAENKDAELKAKGTHFNIRRLVFDMRDVENNTRKLKKYTTELRVRQGKASESEVNEDMIAKAKNVDMTEIFEFDYRGFANCPFHEDNTPSFSYWEKANLGHCFSCGVTVDTIDLVMKLYNKNFIETVKELNKQ